MKIVFFELKFLNKKYNLINSKFKIFYIQYYLLNLKIYKIQLFQIYF
jgi:hypothetical protein